MSHHPLPYIPPKQSNDDDYINDDDDDGDDHDGTVEGAWIPAKCRMYNVYFARVSYAHAPGLAAVADLCNRISQEGSLYSDSIPGSGLLPVEIYFKSRNKDSLGKLLRLFFRTYGYMDVTEAVMSIRQGVMITKSEKNWSKSYYFCIEDPFVVGHNIMRILDIRMQKLVQSELMRAFKLLWPIRRKDTVGDVVFGDFFEDVCASVHQGYEAGKMAALRGKDWRCERCRTTNMAVHNECVACHQSKPMDASSEIKNLVIS